LITIAQTIQANPVSPALRKQHARRIESSNMESEVQSESSLHTEVTPVNQKEERETPTKLMELSMKQQNEVKELTQRASEV